MFRLSIRNYFNWKNNWLKDRLWDDWEKTDIMKKILTDNFPYIGQKNRIYAKNIF